VLLEVGPSYKPIFLGVLVLVVRVQVLCQLCLHFVFKQSLSLLMLRNEVQILHVCKKNR
jgi:hypothetical protein